MSVKKLKGALDSTIERLINLEAGVHYVEPPPPEVESFACIARESPVLISAPHGTRALRDIEKGEWHEEDEYTAGIALLLAEDCGTSVIANVWRSDTCDPNVHNENQCLYKQRLRQVVEQKAVRWVVDLHGAAGDNEKMGACRVDLGTRKDKRSMNLQHRDKLRGLFESAFGKNSVSTIAFPASGSGTITGFCQEQLGIQAIQIEMKPSVRVVERRMDASVYANLGPFSARPNDVMAMLGALKSFIGYLQELGETH